MLENRGENIFGPLDPLIGLGDSLGEAGPYFDDWLLFPSFSLKPTPVRLST